VLLGLGAAAAVGGLYAVGRRELRRGRLAGPLVPPAPPLPEPSWVQGTAGLLRVLDGGSGGPPAVFLHGLGGRAEHWLPVLEALWPRRRAVAFDLRGHGGSNPDPAGDMSPRALAADLLAVGTALDLPPFVLVAHSLAATAAAAFAAAHPERVAGLLLVDPSGDLTRLPAGAVRAYVDAVATDPHQELAGQFRQLLTGAAPGVAGAVLADLAATPMAVLAAAVEAASRESPADLLAGYRGPALALLTPFNALPASLPVLLPGLEAHRVFGTSHWLMLDDPGSVVSALEAVAGCPSDVC
jgi:pimeloyl-ACP methyl ester carboxylesterase